MANSKEQEREIESEEKEDEGDVCLEGADKAESGENPPGLD